MFTFSKIHNWQGEKAVKQILVFPTQMLKDEFEKTYAQRVEKDGVERASDSNAGAVYKIRATKNSEGMYVPVIRCGSSGELLWEGESHPSWKCCLQEAINHLMKTIVSSQPQDLLVTLVGDNDRLVDGKIPAFAECPYSSKCVNKGAGLCYHLGEEHNVAYSCATARAFEMVQK